MFLDFDVLRQVMSYVEEKRDLLSMMYSCKVLNTLGATYLLGFPVHISCGRSDESFQRFMLAEFPNRFHALKQLSYELGEQVAPLPHNDNDNIAKVLANSQNIEHLKLHGHYSFGSIDPAVEDAITSLPNIRTLEIKLDGRDFDGITRVLGDVKSSLVHLSIHSRWAYRQPLQTLSSTNMIATLRSIDLSGVDLNGATPPQLPSVIEARIAKSIGYTIQPMVDAFPNLQSLAIHFADTRRTRTEDARVVNAIFHETSDHDWDTLHHLSGHSDCLYILGLTCHVDHLEVDEVLHESLRVLDGVMRDTTPRKLTASLRLSSHTLFSTDIPTLLPFTPNLTHLILNIEPSFSNIDPPELLSDINLLLHTLGALTHLKLSIAWKPIPKPADHIAHGYYEHIREWAFRVEDHPKIANIFKWMSLDTRARQCAEAAPLLTHLTLDIAHHPVAFWFISRSPDGVPQLERQAEEFGWEEDVNVENNDDHD